MKKLIGFIFLVIILGVITTVGSYFYLLTAPTKEGKEISFYVEEGQTYSTIAD